jgi:CheY-like chemotaxis protein
MDVRMPGMNGIELTQHIRNKHGKNQSAKIIAVTAEAMPSDREKCLQAGMDDYLSKPVSLDELRGIIEQYRTG